MVGNLLLVLEKQETTTHICSFLPQKIEESAKIRARKDKKILQLRDLDELSSKKDIWETVKVNQEADIDVLAVKNIRWAYKGTQTAAVRLPMKITRKALENSECESDRSGGSRVQEA